MYRMHNDSAARFPFASPPVPCFLSTLCVCRFVLVPLVVPAGQVAPCVRLHLLGRELQPHATLVALGGLRAPTDAPVVLELAA